MHDVVGDGVRWRVWLTLAAVVFGAAFVTVTNRQIAHQEQVYSAGESIYVGYSLKIISNGLAGEVLVLKRRVERCDRIGWRCF